VHSSKQGENDARISPVEQRLVELRVTDMTHWSLLDGHFTVNHGLNRVNGNVWDHGRPAREHTPNYLQSTKTMPAVPQRVACLADADARV
jgi:hypothetical protein